MGWFGTRGWRGPSLVLVTLFGFGASSAWAQTITIPPFEQSPNPPSDTGVLTNVATPYPSQIVVSRLRWHTASTPESS